VQGVTGDFGSLQSLGQFMGEEDVAQFAMSINLEAFHKGFPYSESFVGVQAVKINFSKVVSHG